mgnify:CR=1 FL=1
MTKLSSLFQLLRLQQWYKNLLVFAGAVFALKLLDFVLWPSMLLGLLILCLISGANYIVNDIIDIERDRIHPEKKNRPLASGAVSVNKAVAFCVFAAALSFYSALQLSLGFFLTTLALFLTNLLYTFILKNVVFVDVLTISVDYVWRALAGCYLISVSASSWLVICVFLLALLLTLGKRKAEIETLEEASRHRDALKFYSPGILNRLVSMTSASLLISYALYSSMSETGHGRLLWTLPVATYMILRYNYLLDSNKSMAENPEKIFKDVPMMIAFIIWITMTVALLYIKEIPR